MNLIWGYMERGFDYDTAELYADLESAGILCHCPEGEAEFGR